MTNREKVIKGLKCCAAMSGDECRECPYGHECRDTDLPYGMPHLAADALTLLKEQEPVRPDYSPYYQEWYCGNCGKMIPRAYNYCGYCGQAVKWND